MARRRVGAHWWRRRKKRKRRRKKNRVQGQLGHYEDSLTCSHLPQLTEHLRRLHPSPQTLLLFGCRLQP